MNMESVGRPQPQGTPETGPKGSKPELAADGFMRQIVKNGVEQAIFTEEQIGELLAGYKIRLPGVTSGEIMEVLKQRGIVRPQVVEKAAKSPKPIEYIPTEYVKVEGLKEVGDENIKKILDKNHFFDEMEKRIFGNEGDLNQTYEKALGLGKEYILETDEHYYEFASAGLIKGGREQVERDLIDLRRKRKDIEQKNSLKGPGKTNGNKISTIVERSVIHGATNLDWYGKNVRVTYAGEFNDLLRGIDDVLEKKRKVIKVNFSRSPWT